MNGYDPANCGGDLLIETGRWIRWWNKAGLAGYRVWEEEVLEDGIGDGVECLVSSFKTDSVE